MPDMESQGWAANVAAKPAEDHPAQAHVEHHRATDEGMPEPPERMGISPSGQLETSIPEQMQRLAELDKVPLKPVLIVDPKTPIQSTQELWNAATKDPLDLLALEAAAELRRGDSMWGPGIQWPTNSVSHEAYAVLLEEMDELWGEVKAKRIDRAKARKEAIHVAAMALRFVRNVCDANPDVERKPLAKAADAGFDLRDYEKP